MPKFTIDINQEALAYFERARDEWNARHQTAHTLEECIAMAVNNFPQFMADWNELSSFAIEQAQNTPRLERESRKAFMYQLSYEQALEDKAAATRKAVSENAKRAGRCRKSRYELSGTIKAAYRVIDEQLYKRRDLLEKRGGKAVLVRMILDLIAEGGIKAETMPSQRTVETWVNNYIKTK